MALYNNDDMKVGPLNSDYTNGYLDGKKAGATAEHERAQKLADALGKCVQFKNGRYEGKYLNVLLDECENALQQWKGEVVITPDQAAALLHPPDDNSPKGMVGPEGEPFKK